MRKSENIIMHLDMNSYFASVEQQANPFLRGKPVGVCAYLSENGTIIASSTEAKTRGVKTGCRVREAKRLIPGIVLVENEPAKYRCTTEKIFKILAEYTDAVEPYSIDEAFMDMTGWVKDFEEAESLSITIKERIRKEVGEWLRCSIGISWTKFLAKFAGDIAPKGGVLIIDRANLDQWLKRELTDAWGIGEAIASRLRYLGINDLLALKKTDPLKLKRNLGIYGYQLWCNVNGEEISKVEAEAPLPKSIGHSYCLPKKTNDKEYLSRVLLKLCEKTGRRLRASNLEAKNIHFYLSYVQFGHLGKTFRAAETIFTTAEIFNPLYRYLNEAPLLMPVNMMAVSVSKFSPLSGQASLFFDRSKAKFLSQAMDKLNDKYGEYTVSTGLMFGSGDMAHDRIGFRKTLKIEREV